MKIILGTREGIVTLEDGVADWALAGPALLREQIMCLARDRSGNVLFAGTLNGGIFRSLDRGKNWAGRSEGLDSKDVRSLAVHPQDSRVVYAGTSPAALFVSKDQGEHWQEMPSLRNHPSKDSWSFPVEPWIPHVQTIALDPVNPKTMYAGVEVGTVLKSKDGGETWENIGTTISKDVHYVTIHPSRNERVFMASADDTPPFDLRGGHGMYRSDDQGKTWKHIVNGLGRRTFCHNGTAFDPEDPDTLYISAGDGVPPYWSNNSVFLPEQKKAVLTGETAYYMWPSRLRRTTGTDTVIFRTRNAGESWEPIMKGLPQSLFPTVWALDTYRPSKAGPCHVFFGTTSGELYLSQDGGESWRELMRNLPGITHLKALPNA
jgi:photosystem II stability/assembly factor-like uncharacterized protein